MKHTFVPSTHGFNALQGVRPIKHFTYIPTSIVGHDLAHAVVDRFIDEIGLDRVLKEGILRVSFGDNAVTIVNIRTNEGVILTIMIDGNQFSAVCELLYDGFLRIAL